MASHRIRLSGFRELEKALAQLPRATSKNVCRRALRQAAKPIEADAKTHAPELTGHLASVIDEAAQLTTRQRRQSGAKATFTGLAGDGMRTFRGSTRTTVEIHVGPSTDAAFKRAPDPAGLLQEFGTAHHPAQPFMRPAWEGNKDRALETIGRELGSEVDKAAARLARKAARGSR